MRFLHPLVLLTALSACARAKPATGSMSGCSGQPTFIVSNRSNRDVDVLANVGNGNGQNIGTVRAGGNDELLLPAGTTSAYFVYAREGATVATRGRVDTRYSCRP
ncbi:MAG: hypothetical protein ABIY52_03380 [Gemmatimonadaceae bacterium]